MWVLNGYQIERVLAESGRFRLWLASHPRYARKVVLKSSRDTPTSSDDAEALMREYDRLKAIKDDAVIRAYDLEEAGSRLLLVREYFDGATLQESLDSSLPLGPNAFLPLALQLAQALETLHQKEVVHGNLTPANVLVDAQHHAVKFTGFGDKAGFMNEALPDQQACESEYRLRYMAPEQSHRFRRAFTTETDIYALGIIFFQMLSGRLPFEGGDAMELAHSHMAKPAPDLHEVAPQVSAGLSDLVARMLKKRPEERYSDASALKQELLRAQAVMQVEGDLEGFESERISRPERALEREGRLYGRTSALRQLNVSFERHVESGKSVLINVCGASGVGKSSLIENALKEVAWPAEQCLKAKFDQYKPASPFEKLYAALRDYIRRIITKEEEGLKDWKRRLEDALEDQAGVLLDGIPELKWLLGPLPEAVPLAPPDAKARLNQLLCRLMQALAQPQRPLVLVLDDLQWSDSATLAWLEQALEEVSGLIVLGAYRDNEVNSDHPFLILQQRLRTKSIPHETVVLSELSQSAVFELVSAAVPVEEAETVSGLLYEKTGGNAFFVTQYLRRLQQDEVVFYNPQLGRWVADLERLKNLPACDSVVDLLSERMTASSEAVQGVLKTASCIGNRFEDSLLRAVFSRVDGVDQALQTALEEGWINQVALIEGETPLEYQFAHDRIQQAVLSLMSQQEKAERHLRIGEILRTCYQPLEQEKLYECVNHLNAAQMLLQDAEAHRDLAELNLSTGVVAKRSGDFELALSYVRQALAVLPALSKHPQSVDFLRERAECEHLCHNDETALEYYQQALLASDDPLVKARVYELMVTFYTDLSDYRAAYHMGRQAVSLFGISLPEKFNPLLLGKDLLFLNGRLRRYSVGELLNLPETEDEAVKMSVRLLSVTLKAAYQVRPELCVAVSLKVMRLCLQHGNTREAVIGYIVFGIIFQSGVLGRHRKGYEYGELSLALLERFGNQLQRAEVEFVFGYFAHSWVKPAAETEALWYSAYRHGREVGDWFHTGCAAAGIIQSQFMRGRPLDEIEAEINRFSPVLKRIGAEEQWGAVLSVRQAIENLRGATESESSFSRPGFDEAEYVRGLERYGSRHFALYYFVNKMATLYRHRRYAEGEEVSLGSRVYLADSKGMRHATEHLFYSTLIQSKRLLQSGAVRRVRSLSEMERALKQFQRWSQGCAENFLARQRILEGEIARLKGYWEHALRCYDSAIEAATIYGQFNLLFIANNLAADLYAFRQLNRAAERYRSASQKALNRWGVAVTEMPRLNESAFDVSAFDLMALVKATEVIAKEKRLPDLLETLIRILIENAGAQRGVLLMYEKTQLLVQAEASVDSEAVTVMQQVPYNESPNLVPAIVHYVLHSGESVVLDHAGQSALFAQEEVVQERGVVSVLCAPLRLRGENKGVIYLENNIMPGVFTDERTELITLLSGHIAIAIDNARIYAQLEQKVEERTQDLDAKNEMLETRNEDLKRQNAKVVELNKLVVKENEQRKEVENQLHEAIEKLNRLAITDPLTDLHNRRSLDEFLKSECARLKRLDGPMAMILCDIDFFKAYNDHFGHQEGDVCLKRVARALRASVLRPSDLVARYGGEEFAILMPETDLEGGQQVTERIHRNLAAQQIPHPRSEVATQVTMSLGLAVSNGDGCVPEVLLERADRMLYRAKALGRNRTAIDQLD